MEIYKLTGIVLDKRELLNGDREILFLDKNKGKISLLIKGISKSKKREIYSTDTLVISEFMSYKGIVAKVALLDPLNELKEEKFKLRSSLYILFIIKEIIPFYGGREIYNLVFEIFSYLKKACNDIEVLSIVFIFFNTLVKREGLAFTYSDKHFDLTIKSGIIGSKNFENFNTKRELFLELIKNSNYENIINSNLSLRDILTILKLLENHINSLLDLNINFESFMKGFSDERD